MSSKKKNRDRKKKAAAKKKAEKKPTSLEEAEGTLKKLGKLAGECTKARCLACGLEGTSPIPPGNALTKVFYPCPGDMGWHCRNGCGLACSACGKTLGKRARQLPITS